MNDPKTISAKELCELTSLTDSRHRQLANDGFFPKPKRARYLREETLRGLLNYYRTRRTMTGERDELLRQRVEREVKLLDLKIAKEEGKAMPIQEVGDLLRYLNGYAKTVFHPLGAELGARCAGKSAEELNALGPAIADEFLGRLAEAITAWDASRAAPAPTGETTQHLATRG